MERIDKLRISIVGTTSWGTTLGLLLSRAGNNITLIARTEIEVDKILAEGENSRFLPGYKFPSHLHISSIEKHTIENSNLIIFAVPSGSLRDNARKLKDWVSPKTIIVIATKGLEASTGNFMSDIIDQELNLENPSQVCILSGPNLSREIAEGLPTSTVISSTSSANAKIVQDALASDKFRTYVNSDVIGTQLGGAMKNVVAIVAGIADGLDLGDNAKAGVISRAMAEIVRLGTALGANPSTFSGLAGLGDLMATSYSRLSRNRYFGEQLGKGQSPETILANMQNVVEGIDTTKAVLLLAQKLEVEMPIAKNLGHILWDNMKPLDVVETLMSRPTTSETKTAN
ncbi:MAG: NAD(P)-dependent glycerol-3-phosphate dehydrogenase [SAR202 cluster bacterium]|nr:NAD(P)-dependent glycerol-3-phosphate dehydrogenase [SAR202 cluster bacterium]